MLGLCFAMLVACFDGTIVGTIGTTICTDLNGLDLYAWITTAYLLCEAVMIPIAGKLSDLYGRKPLFLIGLGLFTAGSVLAGLSPSMYWFIGCRAIQGLGGGILIPVATAAVADLYAPHERARIQGILGAIFGVGSGIGPLLGGYIEGALSWHWCFYINLPFAIIAFLLTIKKFPTPESDEKRVIDFKGISVLTLLLLDVLLLIELGGDEIPWVSVQSIVMVIVALALIVVFVMIERKAKEPVLAPHLLKNKTVIMAAVFMFIFGIGLIGAMMYSNMFAIAVMGISTLTAGEWSLAMVAGMMITALLSGAIVNKTGYKVWLIVGPILCFVGLWYLSGMTVTPDMYSLSMSGLDASMVVDTNMTRYIVGIFVLGLGLGCMMSVIMAAVQNSSKTSEMGMTTSAVNLIRAIGMTMGTAIFAAVINSKFGSELLTCGLPDEILAIVPHDTGLLNYLVDPSIGIYAPNILSAFGRSVDYMFLLGGGIILTLVIIGIIFKAQKPEPDTSFEAAVEKIENYEDRAE